MSIAAAYFKVSTMATVFKASILVIHYIASNMAVYYKASTMIADYKASTKATVIKMPTLTANYKGFTKATIFEVSNRATTFYASIRTLTFYTLRSQAGGGPRVEYIRPDNRSSVVPDPTSTNTIPPLLAAGIIEDPSAITILGRTLESADSHTKTICSSGHATSRPAPFA